MAKANWTLGIVTLALFVGLGVYLAPLNPNIVTLQFTFSPVAFQAVLDAWGPEGVARYRAHLPVDGQGHRTGDFGQPAGCRAAHQFQLEHSVARMQKAQCGGGILGCSCPNTGYAMRVEIDVDRGG